MRIAHYALIAALAVGPTLASTAADAQMMRAPLTSAAAETSMVQSVQHRHWRGHGHHHQYRHHHGHRGNAGAAIAGGILGIAAGAMIAGAAANAAQAPAAAPVGDPNWVAYCARKYRSFDPASGTYLANDGNRYYCR